MAQLALAYRASYAGHESWLAELEAIQNAVNHLGCKEVEHELDISRSTLSEALHERNNKRWAAEWTHVLLAMLDDQHDETSDQLARAILEALSSRTSRFVIDEVQDLTPDEVIAGLKRELLSKDGGKASVDRVMRRGKKR